MSRRDPEPCVSCFALLLAVVVGLAALCGYIWGN